MAKSSTEAEVACLNEAVSKDKKNQMLVKDDEELSDALVDAHRKLLEVEGLVAIMAQESVVAYKASKECNDDRRRHGTLTYHVAKQEFWSIVAIKFLSLDLDFLDILSELEDEAIDEPKYIIGSLEDQDPSLTA